MGLRLRGFVVVLTAALGAVFAAAPAGSLSAGELLAWGVLTALFAFAERVDLSFHSGRWRVGLSASEAILYPMIVGLPFAHAVLGATFGMAAVQVTRTKSEPLKGTFNVVQYGLAASAAAALWRLLSDGRPGFSPGDALAAVVAVGAFTAVTHLLTLQALALAEGRWFLRVNPGVARAALINMAGGAMLGTLMAASFASQAWTVVFFPAPLIALYIGLRAVLRQAQERERTEHLHAAARALASGPDLARALDGFLVAAAETVSAERAWALIHIGGRARWWGEERGLSEACAADLLERLARGPLVVTAETPRTERALADALGARNLIAVALTEHGRPSGCLIAADRSGADEFGEQDTRLLASLAEELRLSLGAHRAHAQAIEERERFERIFNGSADGICLVDAQGVVRAWNPALERLTGYPAEQALGRLWEECLVLRDAGQRRLTCSVLGALPLEAELELLTRAGPSRWVVMSAGPVQAGEDLGYVLMLRDVTAQRHAEESKSDFLATISHELRTPLTTIKGSLQVLDRGAHNLPPGVAEQMVAVMRRGADRLERLVMNLLTVSQMESGELPVFLEAVELNDVVRERIAALGPAAGRVHLSPHEGRLVVRADRARLVEVLGHLLDNARKFGGGGDIHVRVTRHGGCALVTVSDDGPGVAPADRERIFERFVRLGQVLTRETQGAGVGLFIARRAAEAMGGELWVGDEPGPGATFHLRLPLARPVALAGSA